MKTGYTALDKLPVVLRNGDLILVGGRPGMGKTAFALNIAISAARKNEIPVHVFALEEITEKIVSCVLTYCPQVKDFSISNLPACSTADVLANKVRTTLRQSEKPGLAVIDCLQLISGDKSGNKNNEIRDMIRKLKLLAIELQVPVICCTQLSRRFKYFREDRPGHPYLRFPDFSDQDFDTVIFLQREEYDGTNEYVLNTTKVIVAKNRHGDTGTVEIGWDGRHLRFYDRSDAE